MLRDTMQELWDITMAIADELPFETRIIKAIFVSLVLPLVYLGALLGYLAAVLDTWVAGMRRD